MAKTKQQKAEAAKNSRLWTLFRLRLPEFELIKQFQQNHRIFRVLLGKRLGTDHDHKTGLVRGLLEWRINRAYGLIEKAAPSNTSEVLRALAYFHDNPPATQALGKETFGLIGLAKHKKLMVYGPPEAPRTKQGKG